MKAKPKPETLFSAPIGMKWGYPDIFDVYTENGLLVAELRERKERPSFRWKLDGLHEALILNNLRLHRDRTLFSARKAAECGDVDQATELTELAERMRLAINEIDPPKKHGERTNETTGTP